MLVRTDIENLILLNLDNAVNLDSNNPPAQAKILMLKSVLIEAFIIKELFCH
jgi:hypothetical protein